MTGFDELITSFKKGYGDTVGGQGFEYQEAQRIPINSFAFNLATGGGIPRGKISIIYGPESSGKTNILLSAIAEHQRLWPEKRCVFFDIEGTFNPNWAKQLGVDVDNLFVFKPSYAEQVVDMVEGLLHSEECGIVGVDSLAAMITTREIGQSAEKADVGGSALAIGKLTRKAVLALSEAEKAGNLPTLILINQTRYKIGVMFGDPETMPGGNAPKFAASMMLRVYGKNIKDTKINNVMPIKKEMSLIIKKWKCPIVSASANWQMVTIPHKGHKVGECQDWNLVKKYSEEYGIFGKNEGGGYFFDDMNFKTIKEAQEHFESNPEYADKIKQMIIDTEVKAMVNNEES